VAVSLLLLGAPAAWASASLGTGLNGAGRSAAKTRISRVAAVETRGGLRRGLHVSATVEATSCVGASDAIGEAYRCFGTNHHVYDPCWYDIHAPPFVDFECLAHPWDSAVVRLHGGFIEALPPGRVSTIPWGLELVDGNRCVLSLGANSLVNGIPVRWTCGRGVELLADLNQHHARWRVTEVRVTRASYRAMGLIQVRHAWLGIPSLSAPTD